MTIIMPPPLMGRGIKRWFCLTSVCLSVAHIGPQSRTEKPKKTKTGTEVAHITRDSDTTFNVKSQGHHQAALLTAALTRQATAAVSMGTYWAWETTATLRCAPRREALRCSQREERGEAYRGGRPPTACYVKWPYSSWSAGWVLVFISLSMALCAHQCDIRPTVTLPL